MKKCVKCNKQYDDSKMFCPTCGGQLVPVTPSSSTSSSGSSSWFDQWGGILLAAVGILIEWELSAVFGLAVAAVGVVCGYNSTNTVNKIGSIVAGVIAALLFLIWILA